MRAATIRRPAFSKRPRICPMTFFFTASGLMIERVRSSDIQVLQELAKFSEILAGYAPFRHPSGGFFRGRITRIHAEPRHPDELLAGIKERQFLPLPRRHARLLEQILQRAPRP